MAKQKVQDSEEVYRVTLLWDGKVSKVRIYFSKEAFEKAKDIRQEWCQYSEATCKVLKGELK